MRRLSTCLGLTVLLAGCEPPMAPADPDISAGAPGSYEAMQHLHTTQRDVFTDVIENPCSGQLVDIAGEELQTITAATTDPGKGYLHFEVSYTASGTGLAADGTQYVFHNSEHFVLESPNFPAPQTVVSSNSAFEFVSTNGSPNFAEHAVFHLTVLPSGEFKTTTDFDKGECRG